MILLDTHILIWWSLRSKRLSESQFQKLDSWSASNKLLISIISIWEVEMLDRKKKIQLGENFGKWTSKVTHSDILQVIPLSRELILAQRTLPENFHPDPADRLIVSTAKLLDLPLVTQDQKIIDSTACKIWSFTD